MGSNVIITVAPTGSMPTQKENNNLPRTADENNRRDTTFLGIRRVVRSTREIRIRSLPTSDIAVFRAYLDAVRGGFPIITRITSGGDGYGHGLHTGRDVETFGGAEGRF